MKKILVFILFLLIATFVIAQQPGTVQRSEIVETIDGREYYIHLVRQGQNLQNIASAYQVSVSEINEENPRLKGVIGVGDVIKIPKRTTAAPQQEAAVKQPAETPARQTTPDQNLVTPGARMHTVVAQETFFGIARQYNITVAELQAANPDIETLQPGQILRIPATEAHTPTPVVAPVPQASPPAQQEQSPQGQLPETYTVMAGETLFSISRRFGLTIEELTALNPEISEGLKAGQTIRLKKGQGSAATQYETVQDTVVSYNYHRVRRGETLFSLSRKYGVTIETILEYNPHVVDGLQPRQILQIPKYEIRTRRVVREIVPVEPIEIPTDTVMYVTPDDCRPMVDPSKVYNIALMVPFFLDVKEEVVPMDTLRLATQPNPNRQYEFMQFYYGAMLAIDSLSKAGLNARVFVYDVDNTPESVMKVLNEPRLPDMDLIIGPLYANSFDRVARFAREHRIRIVNPLSPRNEFLLNNPFAIKAQPTTKDQVNLIASYIKTHFPDRNIVVVRQFSFSENETLEIFRKKFSDQGLREVIYIRDSLDGVRRQLDTGRENIIVGLSTDKVFIMDLVRKLNDIRAEYQITCFGLQEWEDFALDTDHIVNLRLHLPSSDFIDYDSAPVKQFIRSFRAKYETEPLPNRFAFAAYDITWYFVNTLVKYGESFEECLPSYRYRGLQMPFSFEHQGRHGMENKGLTIYRIQNFRKVEVYPAYRRHF